MPPVKACKACDGCPMQRLFPDNMLVEPQLPHPDKDLKRIVVGEAPGQEESIKGKPFVGGAGRVLDSLLRSANIDREGLTLINVLNCRPPNNVFLTDPDARSYISREEGEAAVNQCVRNHVLPLLRSCNWNRIDLLGDKALTHIALKSEGIFQWRGSPLDVDTDEIEKAHKS